MPVRAALEKYDGSCKALCVGSARDTNQGWNPQKSIVMSNDKDDVVSVITERASKFIFFHGGFWQPAGEPYYTNDASAWGKVVCVSVAYCFSDGDPSLETSRNAYAAKDRPLLEAEIAKLKAENPEIDAFFSEEIEVLVPEAFHYGERAEATIRSNVPKILSQTAGDFLRTISIWGSTSKLEEYLSKNLGDAIIQSMKEDGHPLYKFSRMDASKALLKLTNKLFEK